MHLHPYLCFEGRCEEAIEFYKKALGAQVLSCMRGKDAPEASCAPSQHADKILHAMLKIGPAEVMMSDGMNTGHAEFKGVTMSISVDSDDQARETFQAISADGGQVMMDLQKTFFASSFGVCTDKFGVSWMVLAPLPVAVG